MKNLNKKTQNKRGAFPVILVIIAVLVLAAGFLGAFGFSFVKRKVMNLASNKLTALQNLAGGKLGNLLPSGSTIKTKLEDLQKDGSENTGGGGGTTGESSGDEQKKELEECKKGTFYQSAEGKMAVVGKEKIIIDGSQYEICCWEVTSNQITDESLQAMKNCSIIEQGGNSMVLFDKRDNRYILIGATLIKDGKQCSYTFDENGVLEDKVCQ